MGAANSHTSAEEGRAAHVEEPNERGRGRGRFAKSIPRDGIFRTDTQRVRWQRLRLAEDLTDRTVMKVLSLLMPTVGDVSFVVLIGGTPIITRLDVPGIVGVFRPMSMAA